MQNSFAHQRPTMHEVISHSAEEQKGESEIPDTCMTTTSREHAKREDHMTELRRASRNEALLKLSKEEACP